MILIQYLIDQVYLINFTQEDSILDKLDHSAPENGLSLDNKGGLLSDLFDDDGNISLPATGEVIKQHWIPVAVVLMSLGGALIFMARRKHQN